MKNYMQKHDHLSSEKTLFHEESLKLYVRDWLTENQGQKIKKTKTMPKLRDNLTLYLGAKLSETGIETGYTWFPVWILK